MKTEVSTNPVNQQKILWLAAGTILAVLPHGLRMPVWILPLTLALIFWRFGGNYKKRILPIQGIHWMRILHLCLLFISFAGVYISFHTLVGREAGSALLVILSGFKLIETYTERDLYITVFLGFFVIITNFFVTETIFTAIYTFFTLTILFTALITFNDQKNNLTIFNRYKIAVSVLLQAVPLMLILFLLFPRIEGPLWGLPKDALAGRTGIDDEMSPGSISQLIQSNDIAFRVEFDGQQPGNSSLYWRGPVLTRDDGNKWTRERVRDARPAVLETSGKPIRYTVTMEPNGQRWLFALEMPVNSVETGYISNDHQLVMREPVNKRIRYQLTSYTNFRLEAISTNELRRSLQLPYGYHNRAIAVAESWRSENTIPEKIIERALSMFNKEKFYYTLTPPLLTGDNVDDFLFNTRQGFCEHYAGAFVVLMRAAGIPARVVLGYQGGTLNPFDNYLIVHQRDAHAWAEVWLDGRGWVRVDPTSAVAPERVEEGISSALPDEVSDVPGIFNMNIYSREFWKNMRNSWDAINNQWIQWVITYGPDRQTLLLKKFGVTDINLQSITVMVAFVIFVFVTISIWVLRQHHPVRDPARSIYDQFCKKMAKAGFLRRQDEGPLDFSRRISLSKKILEESVVKITGLYIAVRYAEDFSKLDALKYEIKIFNPGKLLTGKTT